MFDNITHIVFDLDGLLVDSEPLWQKAETVALARNDRTWDAEISQLHVGVRLDDATKVMIDRYQIDVEPSILEAQIFEAMFELLPKELVSMPGANQLIEQAHAAGYPMAIASSSPYDYIVAVVEQMGWGKYIATLASGYQVPKGKPAPDVFLYAAQLLQVDPQACVVFEDSLNGAKAARAAGMLTVAIPGHGFTPQDYTDIAHMTYPSLSDVPLIKP